MAAGINGSLPATGLQFTVKRARLTFDEQWSPYVRGELVVGLLPESLPLLEPRSRQRVHGWASDGSKVIEYDLMLRGRSYDEATGEATLTVDCDEALLHDSRLVQHGPWLPTSGSVRYIVAHVLAQLGATLQAGLDDATVDPAASLWQPGQSCDEYLKPILTAAGLRLYCDELRRWYLVDADTASSGAINLAGRVVAGSDGFDLDSDESYYDAVIVGYQWTDDAGAQHTVYDTAGTPSGLYDISGAGVAPRVVTLNLKRNAVMQTAVQCPQTGEWYVVQTIEGTNGTRTPYENTYINRLTPAGAYIDGMMLNNGGHGTSIGVEYNQADNRVYIWHAWQEPDASGRLDDLVRFPYAAGTFSRTTTPGLSVLPKFTTARVIVSMDWYADLCAFRTVSGSTETYTRRRISDVLAGRDLPLGTVTLPTGLPTMQGFAICGEALFEYTGAVNEPSEDRAIVAEYAWSDGRQIDAVSTSRYGRNADGSYPAQRHEPEGASLYRDPLTGRASLDLGVTVNVLGSYQWQVYRTQLQDSLQGGGSRVLQLSYPTPPPAPGAAARILARRLAHAAAVDLEARSDVTLRPTMSCALQLRARPAQAGAVSSVEYTWPDNRMRVRTRDLVTTIGQSWSATRFGLAWSGVASGTPWSAFDASTGGGSTTAWKLQPAGRAWSAIAAGTSWSAYGVPAAKTWGGAPASTWANLPTGVAWANG